MPKRSWGSIAQKRAQQKAAEASARKRRKRSLSDILKRKKRAAGSFSEVRKSSVKIAKEHDLSGHNRSEANKAAYRASAEEAKKIKLAGGSSSADRVYSTAKRLQSTAPRGKAGKAGNRGRVGLSKRSPAKGESRAETRSYAKERRFDKLTNTELVDALKDAERQKAEASRRNSGSDSAKNRHSEASEKFKAYKEAVKLRASSMNVRELRLAILATNDSDLKETLSEELKRKNDKVDTESPGQTRSARRSQTGSGSRSLSRIDEDNLAKRATENARQKAAERKSDPSKYTGKKREDYEKGLSDGVNYVNQLKHNPGAAKFPKTRFNSPEEKEGYEKALEDYRKELEAKRKRRSGK